jgi:CheY-like chemotaxis protein
MDDKKVVMVFDDDQDTLMLCSIILSAKGYTVHTCDTCKDIVKNVQETHPDLILMDNWIPDKGGIEATLMLKNHPELQSIPVVFFSANNEVDMLAQQAGADKYISKPFNIDDLEKIVEETLSEQA